MRNKTQNNKYAREKAAVEYRIDVLEEDRAAHVLRLNELVKGADECFRMLQGRHSKDPAFAAVNKIYLAISTDRQTAEEIVAKQDRKLKALLKDRKIAEAKSEEATQTAKNWATRFAELEDKNGQLSDEIFQLEIKIKGAEEEACQIRNDLQNRNQYLSQELEVAQENVKWLEMQEADECQRVALLAREARADDLEKENKDLKEELSKLAYRYETQQWSQTQYIGLEPDAEYENMRKCDGLVSSLQSHELE